MQKRKTVFVSILVATTALVVLSMNSAIADSAIPQWIRSSAKYWAAGNTTDAEYIQGIQYLIQQGIINLPVKEVTATNTGLSDTNIASSFIVHFKTASNNFDIYTISKISQFGQISNTVSQQSNSLQSQFQFESIPSTDKRKYYDLIEYYLNTSESGKETVDVYIDILTKDGTVVETLQYGKCTVTSYYIITNDDKMQYRFTQNDAMELREVANFACGGEHIVTPALK